MSATKICSHIISIYGKQENPPKDRGNLFLSGFHSLKNTTDLQKSHITCVLSIIDQACYVACKIENRIEHLQIPEHKWIDLKDQVKQTIYPHLEEAHSYIKSKIQKHNVLVHCQMGVSRSASIVIAFLMKEFGMSYKEAHLYTKSKREVVNPNASFQKDLLQFEEYLKNNEQNFIKKEE